MPNRITQPGPPRRDSRRKDTDMPDAQTRGDLDRPVALHRLVFLDDGEETTIGRPDIDSYAIFPADGAAVVRRLAGGDTPRAAARWYQETYAEALDVEHIVSALAELGFTRDADPAGDPATGVTAGPAEPTGPVPWQRLGRAIFSPVAWLVYGAVVAAAIVAVIASPDLAPSYHDLFFSQYYTVVVVGLFVGAMPLALLHETFHALAGRRLGIRSRLKIGRRLYYIVLETALDGLVAVPRRRRYLPVLAGMVADVLVIAVLTLVADVARQPDGRFALLGRVCLAFAFATVLRVAWQFFFYLRTDVYVLITLVLGCTDLHETSRRLLVARLRRWTRRAPAPAPPVGNAADRRAARWYSWLIVAGYSFSLATLLVAAVPAGYHVYSGILARLTGSADLGQLLDAILFLAMTLPQIAFTVWLGVRERRRRRATSYRHVVA
jgi:hypothetical protein